MVAVWTCCIKRLNFNSGVINSTWTQSANSSSRGLLEPCYCTASVHVYMYMIHAENVMAHVPHAKVAAPSLADEAAGPAGVVRSETPEPPDSSLPFISVEN